MDKKIYQKPSMKEIMVKQHLLDNNSPQGPGSGGSRVSRDFGEEE